MMNEWSIHYTLVFPFVLKCIKSIQAIHSKNQRRKKI